MARDMALEGDIRQALDAVRMIDTHEHLDTEQEFASQHVDFGRLFLHYANCDLISAGCPPKDMERIQLDRQMSPGDKWRLMAPYWEYMKDTGYGRCLEVAIRDLYGLDGLSAETVEPLSERMAASRREGFYRQVFDKAGIAVALWNRLDRLGPIPHLWTSEYDRTLFITGYARRLPDVRGTQLARGLEARDPLPRRLPGGHRGALCLLRLPGERPEDRSGLFAPARL